MTLVKSLHNFIISLSLVFPSPHVFGPRGSGLRIHESEVLIRDPDPHQNVNIGFFKILTYFSLWNMGFQDKFIFLAGLIYLLVTGTSLTWRDESIPPGRRVADTSRVENLSPALGRGIDSRNRVWNWVAKQRRLAGRYGNPMPTWFLAPIAGLKLPTQA